MSVSRGHHSFLDFVGTHYEVNDEDGVIALHNVVINMITDIREMCEENNIRVVGEKHIVFDGSKSPIGFTAILLLDESHISLHCYADEKAMLAVDCFTCSTHLVNHLRVKDGIKALVKTIFKDSRCILDKQMYRFANA